MTKETPHFHGHRERLRRRVLDMGVESLADLEVLEYLLFGARPRGPSLPSRAQEGAGNGRRAACSDFVVYWDRRPHPRQRRAARRYRPGPAGS